MREYILDTPKRMLLALINASLNNKKPDTFNFSTPSPEDWSKCCSLAIEQGVMALAWDGILKLPKEQMPPQELKIAWALAVEKYERKYEYYCQIASDLSDFYLQHGIVMVQLKGVGLSTYYNKPSHREGGDIDIICFSANQDKLSDEEARPLADKLMEEQGIEVEYTHSEKHSNFYYKGIPIENHYTLLDVKTHHLIRSAEALLRACMTPRAVEILDGKYINIPSPEFNTLFVVIHAAQHYGHGLALHHLYDWACIIQKYGVQFPTGFNNRHFLQGVNALNYICNTYLGTCVPINGIPKLSNKILQEIFAPFNKRELPKTGLWDILNFRVKRFIHMSIVENTFFYTPLWRSCRFWNKLSKSIRRLFKLL